MTRPPPDYAEPEPQLDARDEPPSTAVLVFIGLAMLGASATAALGLALLDCKGLLP